MRARAPGSSANLGPGFDTLGLALSLYTEVIVEPATELSIHVEGEGSHVAADASHLAVRVVRAVLGHDRVALTVSSDVPMARGLGSSAALVVAAAAAAGCDDPLALAAAWEGHADNAAAAVLGGLVTATFDGDLVRAHRLPLDDDLAFVAIVPDHELATTEARGALAPRVAFEDAVFNLGRMGALIAGLADGRELHPYAGQDRLHQAARTRLFPESPALLSALVDGGALVSFWSGAGPTLLGVCPSGSADDVRSHAASASAALGVAARVQVLRADRVGLVVSD